MLFKPLLWVLSCAIKMKMFSRLTTFNEKIYLDFNLVLGGVPWEKSCWVEFHIHIYTDVLPDRLKIKQLLTLLSNNLSFIQLLKNLR